MIQIFHDVSLDWMGKRRFAYGFSLFMILLSTASLVMKGGPRLGIDFTGGTLMQVRFAQPANMDQVRSALDGAGFHGPELQAINNTNDIMVRIHAAEAANDPFPRIRAAFAKAIPGNATTLLRQENVGPKIGKELGTKALQAITFSLLAILIYISFRYEWKFALGAVLALAHDVYITLGILSLCNTEFTLTVMAALLTIAGFSNNDTIVVLDRIRERIASMRRAPLGEVINLAVNETLSRTIITSLTVTLALTALLVFGGEVIHDFAFAMLVGVVFGTYSSVYVASALALDITERYNQKPAPAPAPVPVGKKAGTKR